MGRSVKHLAAYKTTRRTGAIDSRVLLSCAFLAAALCVLALAVLQYLSKQQRTHLTRRMEELQEGTADTQTGKESFALTIAKVKQEETLVELRRATNLLEKLSAELSQLFKSGDALPTNSLAARQFFVKAVESLPTVPQLQAKRAEIEPAIFQIQSAQGTAYLPDLHLIADAKKAMEWASTTSTAVTGFRNRLEELLRDAEPKPSAPTESPEPAKALVAKTDAAGPSNMPAEMKDEAERILGETKTAVAQILEEAQSQANCILAETQKRAETILAALREKEPLEESRIERAAGMPIAETAREPEKKTAISEASSPIFLRVSTDPKIRGQLMAFTTPGNMRLPGMFRAEKAPISLSQLRSFGALEPTIAGLERLVEVASTRQDAVRPRWKFKMKQGIWQRKGNEVAQARSVQQLFTDLGSDFVAAGLLAE
jgi:hypothetical protein